jgi:CheY-like chemotaxis protein
MTGGPLEDLDFTTLAGPAAAARVAQPLTPEQREEALIGVQSMEAKGFHVVIARPAERLPPGNRHHVLVVEDDDDTAALAARALERGGYVVFRAAGAGDAGKVLARMGAPHLVLLDVDMPGSIDGFAMLAKFRGHSKLKDLPIVMFTARCSIEDVTRGLQLGANGYVVKPVKPATLLSVVDTVLKGRPGGDA